MVRFILLLCLFIGAPLIAAPIYHSTDENGRSVFTDVPPGSPHDEINIEQSNDYDWHQFDYSPPRKRKNKKRKAKRATKAAPRLSFDQLRAKCEVARYRYHKYRGRGGNDDWGKYRAKLVKYSERRDYWCSRYLKRK
jgi:hypothetical protein